MHGPGSPPRGRGKVDGPPAQVGRGRITPAQAGKSVAPRQKRSALWDHPRVGGEKPPFLCSGSCLVGSPPRGRGKGPALHCSSPVPGITPAWAGKRNRPLSCPHGTGDHPRVGGEKKSQSTRKVKQQGSPPRGRGKVSERPTRANYARITPAWAGKSRSILESVLVFRDHPRVGGEKKSQSTRKVKQQGSPPRGRGKVSERPTRANYARITPAWAGKSRSILESVLVFRDHPRVGGEKFVHHIAYLSF